jgi:hypothetical protein
VAAVEEEVVVKEEEMVVEEANFTCYLFGYSIKPVLSLPKLNSC